MVQLGRELPATGSTYCEVGMNGGHSAAALLLSHPALVVHSFDMMRFNYSWAVARLLQLRFGRRFVLHPGDSHKTLQPWASTYAARGGSCSLFFIDGDHSEYGTHRDLLARAEHAQRRAEDSATWAAAAAARSANLMADFSAEDLEGVIN